MGNIANRQSLAFSERGQLSQAMPQFQNVKRMNANRTIRTAAQQTQGLWGLISVCFEGDLIANER